MSDGEKKSDWVNKTGRESHEEPPLRPFSAAEAERVSGEIKHGMMHDLPHGEAEQGDSKHGQKLLEKMRDEKLRHLNGGGRGA